MNKIKYKGKSFEIIDNKLILKEQDIENIKELSGLDELEDLKYLNLNHNNIKKIQRRLPNGHFRNFDHSNRCRIITIIF